MLLDTYNKKLRILKNRLNINININKINKNFTDPNVEMIYQPSEGNYQYRTDIKMSQLLKRFEKKDIILTPSGSFYYVSSIKPSMHTDFIKIKQQQRKKVKKEMIKCEVEGDQAGYERKNKEQMAIKILINAISGVMGTKSFLYSPWCYNSITSIVRYGISLGFGTAERMFAGNFYFKDDNDIIEHILTCLLILEEYPQIYEKIKYLITSYENFYIPDVDFLLEWIKDQSKYYKIHDPNINKNIYKLLLTCDDVERSFIYYGQSIYNIAFTNFNMFKNIFDHLLTLDMIQPIPDIDPNNEELDDGDLIITTFVLFKKHFKKYNTPDDVLKDEISKKSFIKCYNYLKYKLNMVMEFVKTFCFVPILLPDPLDHKQMVRKNIILSDTDSIFICLKQWINKFLSNTNDLYNRWKLNAILIYIANKYTDYLFEEFCKRCNVEQHNLKEIKMKNEYFYPSFLRTPFRKNYAGYIAIREGAYLDPWKLELKGRMLKGSDVYKDIRIKQEEFISWLLLQAADQQKFSIKDVLQKIIDVENYIEQQIISGNNDYFITVSIRPESEYKIPVNSIYFYYMVYDFVFSETYGHIDLPTKFIELPLKKEIKSKNINTFVDLIPEPYFSKIKEFLNKYYKKEIKRFIFPKEVKLESWIYKIIDIESIIYKNCFGFYAILNSLGINFAIKKKEKFTLRSIMDTIILKDREE